MSTFNYVTKPEKNVGKLCFHMLDKATDTDREVAEDIFKSNTGI